MFNGINPNNKNQMRIFFSMYELWDLNIKGHPRTIMDQLSKEMNFKVLDAVPQSLFDGWDFWIEGENLDQMDFPIYIRDVPWRAIGTA